MNNAADTESRVHESTKMGDIEVSVHVHGDGTRSLSFYRYSGPNGEQRYVSFGMQLTKGDVVALRALLAKAVR